jgi:hypothetical protein
MSASDPPRQEGVGGLPTASRRFSPAGRVGDEFCAQLAHYFVRRHGFGVELEKSSFHFPEIGS